MTKILAPENQIRIQYPAKRARQLAVKSPLLYSYHIRTVDGCVAPKFFNKLGRLRTVEMAQCSQLWLLISLLNNVPEGALLIFQFGHESCCSLIHQGLVPIPKPFE